MKCSAEGRFSVGEAARMGAMSIATGCAGFSKTALSARRDLLHQPLELPNFDANAQNLSSLGLRQRRR